MKDNNNNHIMKKKLNNDNNKWTFDTRLKLRVKELLRQRQTETVWGWFLWICEADEDGLGMLLPKLMRVAQGGR